MRLDPTDELVEQMLSSVQDFVGRASKALSEKFEERASALETRIVALEAELASLKGSE